MRIGINILYLIPGQVGGTETYARELIAAMSDELKSVDELIIYAGAEAAPTFQSSSQVRIVTVPIRSENRIARIAAEQTLLPLYVFRDRIDVIFSLGYSAPIIHPCPSVVTIHDLNWYYHPEDFSRLNWWMWRIVTVLSASSSDHIVTDSSASASSLHEILHIPESKISAILHGVPTPISVKPFQSKKPYLFTVVGGYPHKNLVTALRVLAKLKSGGYAIDLYVCGLGGRANEEIKNEIAELGIQSSVHILGYVDRHQLAAYYRGAAAFIFPSAYEGFGYPVIEAMSYGVPVVSSDAFALREVVGDGGVRVDPYDVDGYVAATAKIMKSHTFRRVLVSRGKKRIGALQWSKTAQKTLKILYAQMR